MSYLRNYNRYKNKKRRENDKRLYDLNRKVWEYIEKEKMPYINEAYKKDINKTIEKFANIKDVGLGDRYVYEVKYEIK